MKTVEEAAHEVLAAFSPLGSARVPLLDALGRFASEALVARHDSPPFDNSAMDGYAVLAHDVALATSEQPIALAVRGESRAGGPLPAPLETGSAMRIFTGARMPEGADAVVVQEDTTCVDDVVRVRFAVRANANVRPRASDLAFGEVTLPAHAHIGPGEIALLASQDFASVPVFARPRVAIVCTGDELREIGEPARASSIVNSNAYALAAHVREAGAEPWVLPTVRDERADVQRAIEHALRADVVLISGGVSVGDYDVVRGALQDAGVELAFWKVQMKPGKPLAFGHRGRVPVVGLPGNPVSTFVTFELFVRPGLRKMLGDPAPERPRVRVRLSQPRAHAPGRVELLRARLTQAEHGLVAVAHGNQGSGSLPSLAGIDALVVIPAAAEHVGTDRELVALLVGQLPH